MDFIDREQLLGVAEPLSKSGYGDYLTGIAIDTLKAADMRFVPTSIPEVIVLEPVIHGDEPVTHVSTVRWQQALYQMMQELTRHQ